MEGLALCIQSTASSDEGGQGSGANISDFAAIEGLGEHCSAPKEAGDRGWQRQGSEALGSEECLLKAGCQVVAGSRGLTASKDHANNAKSGGGLQGPFHNLQRLGTGKATP